MEDNPSDRVSVVQTFNSVAHQFTRKRKFICKQNDCTKRFLTKGGLQLHTKTHFPDKFLLKCFDCEFTSFQKGNMAKHLSTIHARTFEGQFITANFSCNVCTQRFLTEGQLKAHLLRKHTKSEDKPFKCQLCEYTASEKSDLRKHIRIRHTGERPYGCEFCEFRTHTASGIARHRRTHTNAKRFQCDLCSLTFADKKRLNHHIMKHKNEKPFCCTSCQYSTNRKDNLKTHIRRNHVEGAGSSLTLNPKLI